MATQMTINESVVKELLFTDLVFSIKDLKAGTFSAPFLASTEGEAQRIFTSMVCYGGDNLISKYPSDYELFKIGKYNKRTGDLIKDDVIFIISADSIKNLESIRIVNEQRKNDKLIKENSESIDIVDSNS